MLSPEHSDIRKSLESIQSMLSSSRNNDRRSPMSAATSLSSRLHRASMEGGGTGGDAPRGLVGVAARQSHASSASLAEDAGGHSSSRHPSSSSSHPMAFIRRSPSSAFSTVGRLGPMVGGGPSNGEGGDGGHGGSFGLGAVVRGSVLTRGRETSLLVSPISRQSGGSFANSDDDGVKEGDVPPPSTTSVGTVFFAPAAATSMGNDGSTPPQTSSSSTTATYQPTYEGRDPTPFHGQVEDGNRNKKHSESSSRSGLDPPAKSPMPTPNVHSHRYQNSGGGGASAVSIAAVANFSSAVGIVATANSTPNVHSHHYHNNSGNHGRNNDEQYQKRQLAFANEDQNELSMIDEDESTTGQSLVSNVTGSTFVRTPIFYKRAAAAAVVGGQDSGTVASSTHAATPSTSRNHRPSLVMRESLDRLAITTGRALEGIWDDVGVAPDERASHLADLVERISHLCESKVGEEEALRDQFRKEIADARKEYEGICSALKLEGEEDPVARMRRDPSARDPDGVAGGGVSLQWEYEAMMGRLESLRSVRECATSDMLVSRSRIHEAYAALSGCTVEESSGAADMRPYSDVESDLTLERREEFRRGAHQYEEAVSTRVRAVVSLLFDCQCLIRELEILPSDEDSVGRSEDDFKIMNSLQPIEECSAESEDKGSNRLNGGFSAGRNESKNYTIVSLFESSSCIGISNSALERITSRIAELNGEKRRRRVKLGEMGQVISALWTMLRVTEEEQRMFTASIRGLGMDTIRKGEVEIARLNELKKAMIGQLVRDQRVAIEELWCKTESSESERASFDSYFRIQDEEQLTSEVLVKHEEYVSSLKAKLRKMQPILDLIAKREAIVEERIELELLQKDPDRLKGRGATKQLMKEEKMSRRVTKELPKITSILEETLRQWYVENKPEMKDGQAMADSDLGHFMYQGSPYLQTIRWQEEEWRTRKERSDEERHRKRLEERNASLNVPFGHNAYVKLPGKKSDTSSGAAPTSIRPQSALTLRSESTSDSNAKSEKSRPGGNGNNVLRSGSNLRFGGRGPLGDVSSSRQNSSRPPAPPKLGSGAGAVDRVRKTASGQGYRPASAPRMRL
ncbi:hypothetical protein ACHAXA_002120 [Cyclostephanos tholiformis]|uniref:Uncharacterized protein n=1 Tax=Cyclostephanos tholiformis TaxID=382380 RepID=A0ABD3RU66_9STRA